MVPYPLGGRAKLSPHVSLPQLLQATAANIFIFPDEYKSDRLFAWATSSVPRNVKGQLHRAGNEWREKSQMLSLQILNFLTTSDSSAKSECHTRVVVVRSGDCLSEISRKTRVPVEVIQQLNNLEDIELLQEGQQLVIPQAISPVRPTKAVHYLQGHLDGDRWIVANLGDSLWSLATTFHISVTDLKRANGMTKGSSMLMIGQQIRIPAARAPSPHHRPSLWPPSLPSLSSLSTFELQSALLPLHFMLQPALIRDWPLLGRPEILRFLPIWKAETFGLPVQGGWLSSFYGWKDGRAYFHNGIDIACESGSEVRASTSGRITYAEWKGGYGKTVCIDHGNGLATLYAHNSELQVHPGQVVRKGHVIALSGNTGFSTGPHLHFEIHKDGLTIDPLDVIPPIS